MEENKKAKKIEWNIKAVISQILLLALMITCIFLFPKMNPEGTGQSVFYYAFATFLACGAVLYSFFFEPQTAQGILFWLFPVLYLISSGVMLLCEKPMNLPFWSFGGIFLLGVYGLRTGLFWNFFLFFLAGSIQPFLSAESIWIQMFALILIGFFLPRRGKLSEYVRFLILLGIAVFASHLFFCVFFRQSFKNTAVFMIYLVYAAITLSCILFYQLLKAEILREERKEDLKRIQKENARALEMLEELYAEKKAEEELIIPQEQKLDLRQLLTPFCNEEAALLLRLKISNAESYRHCIRVALVSEQAANKLSDADETLAYAGGLYHEIGRLLGNNSSQNNLTLAEREEFPNVLKDLISTIGTKECEPASKEAAIVFLADKICGMVEYLKKTKQGNVLICRVIDKTVSLMVSRGDLNESGLSMGELSTIRNTFVDTIKEDLF